VHKALVWYSANREKVFSLPAQPQSQEQTK
jgi:hypothetical protein